jgi:hypothetical protein
MLDGEARCVPDSMFVGEARIGPWYTRPHSFARTIVISRYRAASQTSHLSLIGHRMTLGAVTVC